MVEDAPVVKMDDEITVGITQGEPPVGVGSGDESDSEEEEQPDDEMKDKSYGPPEPSKKVLGLKNRFDYPILTGIFSRYAETSLESGFKVVNAFVSDMINIAKLLGCSQEVIEFLESQRFSASKLSNMVKRHGSKKLERHLVSGPFPAIGIDGKEGLVKLNNNKYVRRDKQTVINSLTGKLIDFFIPPNHSAAAIATLLYELLEEYKSLDAILSLNVDNEKKNTGRNNGLIRQLEIQLGHALSWICCILHLVEVVFRHIFEEIDGKANGPQSYTGKPPNILILL